MQIHDSFELPHDLKLDFKKATRLEWWTVSYLCSVIVIMVLVMGSSQAMKTAAIEDMLSMVPSLAFLVASRFYDRKPNKDFPYGYHQAFGIAFLCGAVALFGIGCFLVVDSSISLIKAEHPTIGSVFVFGEQIWIGWLMIAALVYSSVPAIFLGKAKEPLSLKLHNKILHTDATAQKADYMTAFAGMVGIVGIAFGLWWADAAAALFISISVLKDGVVSLKTAVLDLLDRHPVKVKDEKQDPLVEEIARLVRLWPWVKDAHVRFREDGQIYFGEVFVTVNSSENLPFHIAKGVQQLRDHHWKIHDVTIMPVEKLIDSNDYNA